MRLVNTWVARLYNATTCDYQDLLAHTSIAFVVLRSSLHTDVLSDEALCLVTTMRDFMSFRYNLSPIFLLQIEQMMQVELNLFPEEHTMRELY